MGMDNGFDRTPKVMIFVIGDNDWRHEQDWPIARAQQTKYYFHSSTGAHTFNQSGTLDLTPPSDEPTDTYAYDPEDPVSRSNEIDLWSYAKYLKDRRPIEQREDVLIFTSPPLLKEMEITGPISVTLYAASSARDTDFTATLVDVFPDGYAQTIQDGIIRARYRESYNNPTLIEPGEIYQYTIDLWATSYVINTGHRIRVEISSSNFDRYDRNPNTGGDFGMSAATMVAEQTIYHNATYPSHLILPVISR
jgi:hypothetical protein